MKTIKVTKQFLQILFPKKRKTTAAKDHIKSQIFNELPYGEPTLLPSPSSLLQNQELQQSGNNEASALNSTPVTVANSFSFNDATSSCPSEEGSSDNLGSSQHKILHDDDTGNDIKSALDFGISDSLPGHEIDDPKHCESQSLKETDRQTSIADGKLLIDEIGPADAVNNAVVSGFALAGDSTKPECNISPEIVIKNDHTKPDATLDEKESSRLEVNRNDLEVLFSASHDDEEQKIVRKEIATDDSSKVLYEHSNNETLIDQDGFPVSQSDFGAAQTDLERTSSNIQFFVLLLCPKSKVFELIEISKTPNSSTIGDVIEAVLQKCNDDRLLQQKYVGLCRPSDRADFLNLSAAAFSTEEQDDDLVLNDFICDDDILVAVLKGSNCHQMSKISKPILKNTKFKSMIRRRRRSNNTKKSRRRRSSKNVSHAPSRGEEDDDLDNLSVMTGEVSCASISSKISCSSKRDDYSILCHKLEKLSKKLNKVDEGISTNDGARVETNLSQLAIEAVPEDSTKEFVEEFPAASHDEYHMTPKMVASELAHHIGEVFDEHNVEILAVDPTGGDDGSDDGTFATARSKQSLVLGLDTKTQCDMPLNIITTKKKGRRSRRTLNNSQFTSYDDGGLAMQIEAMAAEAEAAFENRHGVQSKQSRKNDVVESTMKQKSNVDLCQNTFHHKNQAAAMIPFDVNNSEINTAIPDPGDGQQAKPTPKESITTLSAGTAVQKGVLSRNFLNAGTSVVSTVVAASQGRINEVHVLQYLGVSIVCIAANVMQQNRQNNVSPTMSFGTKEIFQSAMFLAFMVNGQKYLARVSRKKRGGDVASFNT